ncbi:MAG: hypothetical protein GKR94_05085 [Gammaproteobacteria bacterium]|nr:hypothetical protein [Gammaproteobacteria bacterium]
MRDLYREHASEFELNAFEEEQLLRLRKDGCVVLDGFFKNEVDIVRQQFERELVDGSHIVTGNLSTFDHQYRCTLTDTLYHIPAAASLVYHETILRITAAYKCQIPVYYGRAYRTDPMPEPSASSLIHRDAHGDFTIFVFLEPVSLHNGAGVYVRGSHDYCWKSNIPYSCDEKHVRDVFTDAKDWLSYEGSAGTVVIADTTGYHKGPVWQRFGDARNRSRDVLHWVALGVEDNGRREGQRTTVRLRPETVDSFESLQRHFLSGIELATQEPSS